MGKRLVRSMPLIFTGCLLLTTVIALLPLNEVPHLFNIWDKAQHALAFSVLAITGRLAFTRLSKSLFIGLLGYGASLEVMQTIFTSTRFGEWSDLLADSVGIALGFRLHRLLQKSKFKIKTVD